MVHLNTKVLNYVNIDTVKYKTLVLKIQQMVKERGMDVDMTPSIISSDSKRISESLSCSSSGSNYEHEKDLCFTYFDGWSQEEQVEFIEQTLGRMTHYQHGQINAFLKPMLQRDFISALPGRVHIFYTCMLDFKTSN